jgi:hypothetical protein
MAGRSLHRSFTRGTASAAGLVCAILLLAPGTYGAGAITPVASIAIHRGVNITGAASYAFCGTGKTSPIAAYVCASASVQNATGSTHVWA